MITHVLDHLEGARKKGSKAVKRRYCITKKPFRIGGEMSYGVRSSSLPCHTCWARTQNSGLLNGKAVRVKLD